MPTGSFRTFHSFSFSEKLSLKIKLYTTVVTETISKLKVGGARLIKILDICQAKKKKKKGLWLCETLQKVLMPIKYGNFLKYVSDIFSVYFDPLNKWDLKFVNFKCKLVAAAIMNGKMVLVKFHW